jgi:hypothetical protein
MKTGGAANSLHRVSCLQNPSGFIQSHFMDALTLDYIANIAGVSRFQMSRAFPAANGLLLR